MIADCTFDPPDERKSRGKLYRLADGRAEPVTDFHYESTFTCPNLYVSKAGLLVNWTSAFISVYRQGKWTRQEADLAQTPTASVWSKRAATSTCSMEICPIA